MELHERYRQNALSYCSAAERLNFEEHGSYVAPIALCLGFAIELFLKCVLLKSGKSEADLICFGHGLRLMWEQPELQVHRQQAKLHAQSCFQDVASTRATSRPTPKAGTFDVHLKHLSELHSSVSKYVLRYPNRPTMVPECSLMICVFERLIRAEGSGGSIERVIG